MYPEVKVDIKKINENIKIIKTLCMKNNLKLSVVIKVLAGNDNIVEAMDFSCVDSISDSRIQNLKKYQNLNVEKWLITIPANDIVDDVVKYSDVSFNCDLNTIKLLNEAAIKINKKHKIILMYELGDLREGLDYSKLSKLVREIKALSNIQIYGLGANLTCYGGIAPSIENTNELYEVKQRLEKEHNIKFEVVSGANSSSYKLLMNGTLKNKMNYVRFGESVFLGMIPGYYEEIVDLNKDSFVVEAKIVELEEKNSIPKGEILKDSFGKTPVFVDNGRRKMALLNIGKQDVGLDMKPIDKDIKILGGSSDYLILDVTDSKVEYKIGDVISFIPDYEALLKVMTSSYVRKEIIK